MKDDMRAEVIEYWMQKGHEALESARSEQKCQRLVFAVNRAYYACFYAASAVLMKMGKTFRKHTGGQGFYTSFADQNRHGRCFLGKILRSCF